MKAAPLVYANDAIVEASLALIFREKVEIRPLLQPRNRLKRYNAFRASDNWAIATSTDERERVAVSTNMFVYTRSAPYERWSSFIFEVRRCWSEIEPIISNSRGIEFSAVALRYVNQFDVPGGESFAKYFNAYIIKPADIPAVWQSFHWGIDAEVPDTTWHLRLEQRSGEGTAVRLEIDLRSAVTSTADVWDVADEGRALKNRYFNVLITDAVRNALKGEEFEEKQPTAE